MGFEMQSVLLVDDEKTILSALKRDLSRTTVRVDTTTSPTEALSMLERKKYLAVITDHRLPEMTGVELLEQVRAQFPEVVGMLLSGAVDLDSAMEAVNRGNAYRVLTKPWNSEQLCNEIRVLAGATSPKAEENPLSVRARRELERQNPGIHRVTRAGMHVVIEPVSDVTRKLAALTRSWA